jgi:hypothetical protein
LTKEYIPEMIKSEYMFARKITNLETVEAILKSLKGEFSV